MKNIFIIIITLISLVACANSQIVTMPPGEIIDDENLEAREKISYGPPSEIARSFGGSFFSSRMKSVEGKEVKIAILLPLSGKFSKLGSGLLDSAQLALFYLNEDSVKLVPYDTKGTAIGAIGAAKSAINDNVSIILGPVFSQSARAVANVTKESNVNVISFSNDESLADSGVYIIGIRPADQIKRVIRYSLINDIEDYVSIVPNNSYGAVAARVLRETVSQYPESAIIRTEFYQSDDMGKVKELEKHVKSALWAINKKKPPKDYDEEEERYNDNPIKFPRGFMIPEGGYKLSQFLEFLKEKKLDKEKTQLIGTMQWDNPELLNDELLEGAIFARPPQDKYQDFSEKFKEYFGYEAPSLGGVAYDAVALSIALARMSDGEDYSAAAITNPRGFAGINGVFRINPDGLSERAMEVVKITDGKFKVIDDAPSRFEGNSQWYEAIAKKNAEIADRQVEVVN